MVVHIPSLPRLYLVILAGLFLGLQIADVISTMVGVNLGHQEINPLAAILFSVPGGRDALVFFKLSIALLVTSILLRLSNTVSAFGFGALIGLTGGAVLSNIIKILGG